ncbi:MAG TPA: nuclear transport factor 2 family protein [Solirubrobacteraceae bacterium]|jgi:ketosteroid isomerase-like protein|nr:nuclear transport factor 2 family protein [Solirubrobacteraceae bacterium]
MSQETVDIARQWIAFSNAGDLPSILDLLDPDVECFPAEGEPEAAPFRGRDAFAKSATSAREAWDERTVEALEYVDLGEYVAVVARITAVGVASRAPVSMQEVWLVRFRNGKCVEYRECGTKERAVELAYLGLED